jgi:GNAT superfamily N-acetyltransferase
MGDAGAIPNAGITIRPARADEIDALEALIVLSARALSRGFYDARETEAAITHVFGVDTDLVADGTYLVAEEAGQAVGCGGWSRRKTLFGGDRFAARESGLLDPAVDAARIRAFFVAPGHARKGIASALLEACEASARQAGFQRMTLMATLPGVPFYAAHGYQAGEASEHLCGDVTVRFVVMNKDLLQK